MTHLSARALKGLKQYQYKSGGYTLLDGFHTPIWNGKSCCPALPASIRIYCLCLSVASVG